MKRMLLKSLFALSCALAVKAAEAQNDVYWREGFDGSDISTTNPGNQGGAQPFYAEGSSSGTWYLYGAYRTTGQACPSPYGPGHIRFRGGSIAGGALQQLITPIVNHGVNEVHFTSTRSSRTFNFYWTADTAATTANWNAAGTSSPSTLCVDNTITINQPTARRIKIESNGDSDIDSIWLTSVSPLPVTFGGVSAAEVSGRVRVTWKIFTEDNTARYEIERSSDGRNFASVGTVGATQAGNYSWLDASPIKGTSFYRIKAIDRDGASMYSGILRILTGSKGDVSISPNPVKGGAVNLQVSNLDRGTYTVSVFNGIGQVVLTRTIEFNGGVSSFPLQLPGGTKAGIYNLQLRNGAEVITKKVIVE
ncbi:T9SS type A sorting domain-containing protein [Aridibaculum aurantiacum]|uniref:T9SS type A sorting domain-containing protein n=1 Tax=Aridibaculum aurantiacum TaxID=2810307 RepID=UPI001A962DC9|nr:T9SS type A sorting domain-containing protein [Aridibaculum aurantiacum]